MVTGAREKPSAELSVSVVLRVRSYVKVEVLVPSSLMVSVDVNNNNNNNNNVHLSCTHQRPERSHDTY